jgi:hypothetical protein
LPLVVFTDDLTVSKSVIDILVKILKLRRPV